MFIIAVFMYSVRKREKKDHHTTFNAHNVHDNKVVRSRMLVHLIPLHAPSVRH